MKPEMGITLSFTYLVFFMIMLDLPTFSYSCGANSYQRRRNREQAPFQIHQRVPNVAEFSTSASGVPTGKITGQRLRGKNSTLVPCYNTNVVFKDEEGTGADRLMSRRCREKLNELAKLVKSDPEWSKLKPPIKLRVIEAWDEDNQHSENSLHYEGRAVDITTSDMDESKYGKLARLAYEAHFDWVYFEDHLRIHASVREDGAVEKVQYRGCFNADSSVKLQNGRNVAMRDLKVGDKVESMTESGDLTYSEILLFIDNQPQTPDVPHCIIETERADKRIVLTPTHLIFTLKSNDTRSRLTVKYAESVKVGEFVLCTSGGKLVPRRVSKVYLERRTGTLAPLTRHGNIIVDGILASCYAVTGDHSLAHWSFIPVRLWHQYAPAIFEWDPVPQNGTHWYANFLISLNRIFGVTRLS